MKNFIKSILIVIITTIFVPLFAQEYKYKQDPWDKEKINIFDTYGNKIGYYKTDLFDKSKINVYDTY